MFKERSRRALHSSIQLESETTTASDIDSRREQGSQASVNRKQPDRKKGAKNDNEEHCSRRFNSKARPQPQAIVGESKGAKPARIGSSRASKNVQGTLTKSIALVDSTRKRDHNRKRYR